MRIVFHFMHRWTASCLLAAGLVACSESQPTPTTAQQSPTPTIRPATAGEGAATAPAEPDAVAELRTLAEQLWAARRDNRWDEVYSLIDPIEHGDRSIEEFVEWNRNEQPFIVHSFRIDDVVTDEDLGWVKVFHNVEIRNIPDSARDVHRWEKWRIVDGDWRPIPPLAHENYPSSPALRDAAAEQELRARFAECWQARYSKNYEALYEFYDPAERAAIPVDEFGQTFDKLEFLSAEVFFVEVMAGVGKVRVLYSHRPNDPNLRNIAPTNVILNEIWTKIDDEWYLSMPPGNEE